MANVHDASSMQPPPPVLTDAPWSPVPLPGGVTIASPWQRLGAFLVDVVLMLVTLFVGWIIWALMLAGDGQTPGKKLVGEQRVIRAETSQPVGLGTMLGMRGIVGSFVANFAVPFTLGIVLLMPFWDARSRNLWDRVSSTLVVCDPHNGWGR